MLASDKCAQVNEALIPSDKGSNRIAVHQEWPHHLANRLIQQVAIRLLEFVPPFEIVQFGSIAQICTKMPHLRRRDANEFCELTGIE